MAYGQRLIPTRFLTLPCTDINALPSQIIEWFVMRWSVETTFQEVREQETQRQWSDLPIARSTPVLLGLFSIVTILAMHLSKNRTIPFEQTAWYKKTEATFSDCIALVRSHIVHAPKLEKSASQAEFLKFFYCSIEPLFEQLPIPA